MSEANRARKINVLCFLRPHNNPKTKNKEYSQNPAYNTTKRQTNNCLPFECLFYLHTSRKRS